MRTGTETNYSAIAKETGRALWQRLYLQTPIELIVFGMILLLVAGLSPLLLRLLAIVSSPLLLVWGFFLVGVGVFKLVQGLRKIR
jgi:hypothetical protein